MKKIMIPAFILLSVTASAQNNTTANIIEGGKTLVELVRVFKMPNNTAALQPAVVKTDSCAIKNISDFTIKNSAGKPLLVSLYRRNGNTYEAGFISLKVLPKNQESIYELKAGIYKMKIEIEEDSVKKIFREGEIKLIGCENVFREIKNE